MTSLVISAAPIGYDGQIIQIESDTSNGLPGLIVVGLGNKAIDEAKERIRSAIKNSQLNFPRKRITLNLAPADIPKDGASYDLPMAIALLVVSEQIKPMAIKNTLFVGELALDGSIRPVKGIINYVETARRAGITTVVVPESNAKQASLIQGITILPAKNLKQLYAHFNQLTQIDPYCNSLTTTNPSIDLSLNDIHGQEQAKRALIIAAAGHHNLLLDGPPGTGKTLLAKTLTSILPPPSSEEIISITKLHSLAGELQEEAYTTRPFRAPHHTTSHIALIGGGKSPKPGEISLAHHGVLFMDEFPEFSRSSLEALRQPLEDKVVHIARANSRATYPADFMLVATQNPCPCGYLYDKERDCTCAAHQIERYRQRISGPLLDRIDLIVRVSKVNHSDLLSENNNKVDVENITKQIENAMLLQKQRYKNALLRNAHLSHRAIKRDANLLPQAKSLLDKAASTLRLSARVYMKIIRIARTIADLEGSSSINLEHVSEALQYRQR